ncbi:MAG TPA: DPP IV N-terminal domain-containing protein [Pirellulales bacterium]|jgi:dipeptidyl-peptidase-4|nr:DPP IV N-terminal domain-containing protein [Pirellulales bacterium]
MLARLLATITALLPSIILAQDIRPHDASLRAENEDFLRQYAETYRFSLGRPRSAQMVPGGSAVLFLRSQPRSFVQDLYEFNCQTGSERVLLTANQILLGGNEQLSAEEKALRERLRLAAQGIARFDLSDDGTKVLVPLSNRLFVVERESGKSAEVRSSATGFPLDPSLSPDGMRLACVRDGEIYVTDLPSGEERPITSGAGGTITNGTAEFVAQEEMDRVHGYWWSPNSRWIAYQQTDTAGMETFHILDLLHPESEPNTGPYPRTGTKNASVRLAIAPAAGGESRSIDWDREKYPYLAQVVWKDKGPLTILVQNRRQTEEILYAADEKTGALTELLRETDPAWINLAPSCPKWLQDGSGFLWLTERTGEWSLELRSREGKLVRSLTPSGFGLVDLAGVDEERNIVYVTASTDPTEQHVYSIPLAGDEPAKLTSDPGNHAFTIGRQEGGFIHSYSLADGRAGTRVCRTDGDLVGELKSVAEEPPLPNLELLTVGQRVLRAAIIRPRSFVKGAKYPVIVHVYGGPHALTVNSSPRGSVLQQWLADQGFVIVSLDGRGTPRRGREWERAIKNNLIDIPLQDQVDGLQALGEKNPELDLGRVGITGWSFGGYFSAMAAMRRPDIYKAAVAGAPVCDFRDYDTHYTERYMGLPDENRSGYEAANVVTYCKDLSVPLLIIHGTADDNVYFLHSLKMTEALFRAGKKFEFLPLAGFTHMVPDPNVTVRLQTRIAAFFKQHLGEPQIVSEK